MKRNYMITCLVLLCCILTSCETYQSLTIKGQPGTEIYSPNMDKVGVISNKGIAKITLSRDGYYAYLMSLQPGTSQLIPFALDFHHKSFNGTRAELAAGYILASAGLLCTLTGGFAAIGGTSDLVAPFLGGGLGAALLGACIGGPAASRCEQTQYKYHFQYLPFQSTNQDIQFTSIVDEGTNKNEPTVTTRANKRAVSSSASTKHPSESSVSIRKTSSSKRIINDLGKAVSGIYKGTGMLIQDENTIEKYNNIRIEITRIDRNHVYVNVIENGESFFSSESEYSIKTSEKGYTLTLKDIPSAIIVIDTKGQVAYYHPKVNIEGEIYTLEISANK